MDADVIMEEVEELDYDETGSEVAGNLLCFARHFFLYHGFKRSLVMNHHNFLSFLSILF